MKLSDSDLKVLRNFSTINPSIFVHKGNVIRTVSPGKTILAEYRVTQQEFPVDFAIYDLTQFLSVASLFDDPEYNFTDRSVVISDQNSESTYFFADPNLIASASNKQLVLPDQPIEFAVSDSTMKAVLQAAYVLKLPEVHIVGDGEKIQLVAGSTKHQGTNRFARPVGDTDQTFQVVFKIENLKFMPGGYNVAVSSRGISKWEATTADTHLVYWVAVEAGSTFGS